LGESVAVAVAVGTVYVNVGANEGGKDVLCTAVPISADTTKAVSSSVCIEGE
jgi:hypothetical protein